MQFIDLKTQSKRIEITRSQGPQRIEAMARVDLPVNVSTIRSDQNVRQLVQERQAESVVRSSSDSRRSAACSP